MRPTTVVEIFRNAVFTYRKPDAFLVKREGTYRPVSHKEFATEVDRAAAGLLLEGVASGDRVALLSENRIEWAIFDLAALSLGAVVVPIFPTLPPAQIEHVLRDSGARWIVVSTPEQLAKIRTLRPGLVGLRRAILIQGDPGPESWVLTRSDLLARADERFGGSGANITQRSAVVSGDALATILYTSGTTGEPKGVMLTHRNVTSNVLAAIETFDLRPTDVCLSFLPLSHIFERVAGYYVMFYAGVSIAYAESYEALPVNLEEVRPTILVSVPRLYEKIHDGARETARRKGPLARALFEWSRAAGTRWARERFEGGPGGAGRLRREVADRLVFAKLRARLGGRVRFAISGGAPLAREVSEFFFGAGIPIYEGYGLTETSPVLAANSEKAMRFGSVGRPFPGVEVRIAPDGEILARGPGIMAGYLDRPDATAAALRDGWFHSGDLGRLDEDGFLWITGRKKDLIVTAGGKNVAPQPIENRLRTSRFVQEAILIGDRQKFVVALVVPSFPDLEAYARHKGIPYSDPRDLVRNDRVRDLFRRQIEARTADLAPFERVGRFLILDHEFRMDEDEVTPTMKLRRQVIERKYAREIEALYAEGSSENATSKGGVP